MSDSLPPDGGPEPFDGWDLEGLLSGENVWLPSGMRPVAGALDSLRSAPMRAELSGEAAARAAFREIMVSARSEPAVSPALASARSGPLPPPSSLVRSFVAPSLLSPGAGARPSTRG
jgi:hypothetical protein